MFLIQIASFLTQSIFSFKCLHWVNHFPNKPWILCVCSTSLLKKTVRKEEIACVMDDHSFKHGCFPIQIQYLTTALGEFSLAQWLWYWLINRAALVRIPQGSYISAMHLFISFFVTDFVRKMGARPGLAVEPLIPFIVQKMDSLPNRLSVINK